jgi:ribonuclease P protein component
MRRHQRIGRREEISRILRKGTRWACADFALCYAPNDGDDHRTAILVSRRLGGAVQRNRLKRVLRHVVWMAGRPPSGGGMDVIFRPCAYEDFRESRARTCFKQWVESVQVPRASRA